MYEAIEIAKYFLNKDPKRTYFNHNLITRQGIGGEQKFYEGNAKLNKFLHIAQELYIARTGKQLISDDFYAFTHGAIVDSVRNEFNVRLYKTGILDVNITDEETKDFLDRIYNILKSASIDDLIELSHEDDEWQEKSRATQKTQQKMNFMKNAIVYKERFSDALKYMYKDKEVHSINV
ncbi:MAG: SocA family protein [Clostridiales bacterium]|jgi:uncharacterized phage-associated protein|nr:SocA family protein [Clostridiales bacterium]